MADSGTSLARHNAEAGSAQSACVPGVELAHRIRSALNQGRPGWWVGAIPGTRLALGVPRATFIRADRGADLRPPVKPLEAVLPPRLGLALQAQSGLTYEQLTTKDRAVGNRLYAAALRDLLGLDYEAIADACAYVGDKRERTARRAVQVARRLWHEVGAWPWFHFAAPGRPPSGWPKRGGSPQLDAMFWTWATGCFHIPLTGGGARPVGPGTPGGAQRFAA
jgi:hypothetical protein